MPNPGRGTTQDSQRRGATNASAGRSQGKNQSTSSARSAGRSGATSTSSRQSSTSGQRGASTTKATSGSTQSSPAPNRSTQINQADGGQTTQPTTPTPETNREQTTASQPDREMPMQPSRETSELEATQPGTSQSVGKRSSGQSSQIYGGGYGGGYGATGNPFMAVRRIMEDMDRLASNFGFGGGLFSPSIFEQDPFASGRRSAGGSSARGLQALWSPQIDVFQRGDQIVVRADLPGMKKEDVNVEIEQNALTIRGARRQEFEDESEGVYRSERSYGNFQRSIPLPEGIETDDAEASFNDGVLEITLPTPKNQGRSRKLQIR